MSCLIAQCKRQGRKQARICRSHEAGLAQLCSSNQVRRFGNSGSAGGRGHLGQLFEFLLGVFVQLRDAGDRLAAVPQGDLPLTCSRSINSCITQMRMFCC